MTIREARPDEAEGILAVWRAAAEASSTDDVESVAAAIAAHHACFLVAEADDEIVGTMIAGWDGWRGTFYRLAVLPAYRRRGTARELLQAGEQALLRLGARRVAAIVVSTREPAMAFWSAAGYEAQHGNLRFAKTLA